MSETSVGEDFPREMARVQELLQGYREIGPAGAFGAMMLEAALRRATEAQARGDVVAILRSYAELRDCE
jgi:hypothetical protein